MGSTEEIGMLLSLSLSPILCAMVRSERGHIFDPVGDDLTDSKPFPYYYFLLNILIHIYLSAQVKRHAY